MSAKDDIRDRALMYQWERFPGDPGEDIYLRGDCRIYVQYGMDGRVNQARLARSPSLKPGHTERTIDIAKAGSKTTQVIAWLAA